VSVYVASASRYAPLWRSLRAAGLDISASWIDQTEATEAEGQRRRDRRLSEAAEAEVVILYHELAEAPTLSLQEAGAALAMGKRVLSVGPRDTALGRSGHPNWVHCHSLVEALRRLQRV
jgi:hypothetical protein